MTREEAIQVLQTALTAPFIYGNYAVAIEMAIEALSAEPTDLISRADAIKAIESRQTEQWIDADIDYNNGLESAVAEIKELPSADRPSGEWTCKDSADMSVYWFECSECGELTPRDNFNHEYKSNYCPNCGAKMGGNK